MNKKVLAKMLMTGFERSYTNLFSAMKQRGLITKNLEKDFLEFSKESREKFDSTGNFSIDMMLIELPNNKWTPIYISFCAVSCAERYKEDKKNFRQICTAVLQTPEFKEAYKKARYCTDVQ